MLIGDPPSQGQLRSPDARSPRILVFDSGLGGLSVLAELIKRPDGADIIYVADDAAFPYGAWDANDLVSRITGLIGDLIATHRPDVVVIACNTASTLVLPVLRYRYPGMPFVGTVPAIKPASEVTRSGLISVLATPGTVARDYTRALIDTYASHRDVTLVGSSVLAEIAESWLRGEPIDEAMIASEIAPCFQLEGDRRTDTIVLGCTHYPLLLEAFKRLAPWPVTWIDPAPAIARRVAGLVRGGDGRSGGIAIFTSGRELPAALSRRLAEFGLRT